MSEKDKTAVVEQAVKRKILSTKELMSYCFGLFGFQMIVGYLQTYQAQFFNRYAGCEFFLLGIILCLCKLATAIVDPFIGNLIDRNKSKMGKLKPFILGSIIPLVITTILIFVPWPGLNETGNAIYFYICATYLCWCIAMTFGDIPSQAMGSVITTDMGERTNAISLGNTFKTVGLVFPAVIIPLVSMIVPGGAFFMSGQINELEYMAGAIVCAVVGCGMFALIAIKNKERVPYQAERISIKDMFVGMKNNKYLMIAFLTYILGFGRMGAVAIATQTAGALLGQETQSMFVGLSTAIGGMISMLVTPILVKKFDVKKTFIGMSVFHFVVSGITMLVAWLIGFGSGHGTYQIWILYILLLFRGMGCGAYYVLPTLMIAESVDYNEWKTGKRTEGIAYAVNSFAIKVTMALCTLMGLGLISLSGYSTGFDVTAPGAFTTQMWVFFAFCGAPGIFYLLSIIPMFWYDLVGKKKQQMVEDLDKRWAEQNALNEKDAEQDEMPVDEDVVCADETTENAVEVAEVTVETPVLEETPQE